MPDSILLVMEVIAAVLLGVAITLAFAHLDRDWGFAAIGLAIMPLIALAYAAGEIYGASARTLIVLAFAGGLVIYFPVVNFLGLTPRT